MTDNSTTTQIDKPVKTKRLSVKHGTFAALIADGLSQADAYVKIYGGTPEQVRPNACRLANQPLVAEMIRTLTKGHESLKLLSRDRKRELLARIAENDIATPNKLTAIRIDNEMTGENAPIAHDVRVHHLHELLQSHETDGETSPVRSSWADDEAIDV